MAEESRMEEAGISAVQALPKKDRWWYIFFTSIWGWLIIAIYLLLLAWGFLNLIFPALCEDTSIRVEMFSLAATLVCSMLFVLALYSLRRALWESWWRRRVSKNKKGLSLEVWGPILLGAFMVFILTYAVIRVFWLPEDDSPESLLRKFILLLLYILGFSSFVSGAAIFVMLKYIDWLNERLNPPLFVDINALAERTFASVKERLNTKDPLSIVGVERTSNGGVKLTVERLAEKEEKGKIEKEIKRYEVTADERGQILFLKEQQKEF